MPAIVIVFPPHSIVPFPLPLTVMTGFAMKRVGFVIVPVPLNVTALSPVFRNRLGSHLKDTVHLPFSFTRFSMSVASDTYARR